jgi:RNA polymerase sigma-70 factor (ECF subfamily)
MSPAEEAELVAQARAGSAAAFGRLVDAVQARVRGFARRLTGDHADGDDLAQDALILAWERLERFAGRSSFAVFVCGIVFQLHRSWRRSLARRRARDAAWLALGEVAAQAPRDPAPADALRRALGALPADQRACVALCLAGEFSQTEAALALGLPLGTVKSHISRSRTRLAEILGGEDEH